MRRGTSMPELLVAMLVLMMGIWVVAAKFPQLSQVLKDEYRRDQAAKTAEQLTEQAKDDPVGIPLLTAVYNPTLRGPANPIGTDPIVPPWYDPMLVPDWDDPARPLNAVENMTIFVGETFRAPSASPTAASTLAPYFIRGGPAEEIYSVYEPIPLTRAEEFRPTSRDRPAPGTFYARDDGRIALLLPQRDALGNSFTPSTPGQAVLDVSYEWVDPAGNLHRMNHEQLPCGWTGPMTIWWFTSAPVSAVTDAGGSLIPQSVTATFRYEYQIVALGSAPAPGPPPVWVEWNFGASLWFDLPEQGRTFCVDYRAQRHVNPADPTDPDIGRRIPFIREIHRVPDEPTDLTNVGNYELWLNHRHLDADVPLFAVDLSGNALAAPLDNIHVLAFDLEDGSRYSDADGNLIVEHVIDGELVPGWNEGRIAFPPGSLAAGRELLFLYRNYDRETVQLQRAADSFAEDIWTGSSLVLPPWAVGRSYLPTTDGATYDPTGATIVLPDSALTQTVRVEYVGRAGYTVEVHTLGEQSPAVLTVDDPMPTTPPSAQILSVSGVSLKGFATWFDRGKLRTADVETLLTAGVDPLLAMESRPVLTQP